MNESALAAARRRMTIAGASMGAVAGLGLVFWLRAVKGEPPYFLAKSAAIVAIVAAAGAFVGLLLDEYRRRRPVS